MLLSRYARGFASAEYTGNAAIIACAMANGNVENHSVEELYELSRALGRAVRGYIGPFKMLSEAT